MAEGSDRSPEDLTHRRPSEKEVLTPMADADVLLLKPFAPLSASNRDLHG